MAESVLEVVRKLQSRLASEPKKLMKTLKKLSELPITIDILMETGVGKTVNGLRKHELVGEFARNLVARWKKLVPVPQETERHHLESTTQGYDQNISRKRQRDLHPKEDEKAYSETYQPSCSQSYELDCGSKKTKRYSDPEKSQHDVSYGIPEDRSWRRGSSDLECSDYGHTVSSELSESPQELYMDLHHAAEQEREQKSFPQKGIKSHQFQDRQEVTPPHRSFSDCQDKASSSRSKEPKSSQKERQWPETKGKEKAPVFSPERLPKASSSHEASLSGSSKEKPKALDSLKQDKKKDGGGIKKEKAHFDLDDSLNEHRKKQKTHDFERAKPAKMKLSVETVCGDREKPKPVGDLPSKNREKKASSSFKTSEGKPKVSESNKRPAGFSLSREGEAEDVFEQPTMSFESYLSYDLPQKKKRKLAKPTTPVPEKEKAPGKQNGSKCSAKSSDASRKAPKPPSEKKLEEPPKAKKLLIDVVPMLPDIPLPPIQANYRPLPSMDTIPFTQPKRRALSSPTQEDESGFTGRRLNSKMQVYSGSKSAYLPKMMSLHEQCIRVLSNNIDSIYEVGGVPYSVIEPVLERCTPEQLYRIEEYNHVLTEDTDQLWQNHCQRDFKKEKPDEFESWREMYLRLHDAREQRLLMLTQNIRSAHANKPKARVAKMAFVNSTVKPPREVRRRQEKFGTGGAAVPEKIKIKPLLFTPVKTSSVHAEEEPAYDRPSTSSGLSGSSLGSISSVTYDPRKPQVKKIAPMMAKTIKAFKNRFSRR